MAAQEIFALGCPGRKIFMGKEGKHMGKREAGLSAFWDKRAESYDDEVYQIYERAYEKTMKRSRPFLQEEDTVLEIGCGTGILTLALADTVKKVTAVDTSAQMLAAAWEKAEAEGKDNIEFRQGTFDTLPAEKESYDAIAAYNVLLYLKDRDKALDKIYDLLKPGGIFLSATDCLGRNFSQEAIEKFVKSRTGRIPYVAFETPVGLMRRIQRHGFLVLEIVNLHRNPPNIFIAAQKIERKS